MAKTSLWPSRSMSVPRPQRSTKYRRAIHKFDPLEWHGAVTSSQLDPITDQLLASSAQTIMRSSSAHACLRALGMRMSAVNRFAKTYSAIALLRILSACVNVEVVQKFSSQPAALTSSNEINSYLQKGSERQKEYSHPLGWQLDAVALSVRHVQP